MLAPADVESDFRRLVGEAMRHDPILGVNLVGGSPDPVMILWSPRIYEFLAVMESVLSFQPARGLCREVGSRSGMDGAREFAKDYRVSGPSTLLAMPRVLASAGWGVSELTYDDEGGRIAWTFPKGTAVGIAAGRSSVRINPACAFYEGFAAGWVEGSIHLKVEFSEVKCCGAGAESCAFESRSLG